MLKRIEVENFKSLKHLDYHCAKLNLLMGLNGAGKSSFVQFLLLLRSLSDRLMKASVSVKEDSAEFPAKFDDCMYCYATKRRMKFTIDFSSRAPRGFTILNFEGSNGRPMINVPRLLNPSKEEDKILLENYTPRLISVSRYIFRGEGHAEVSIVDSQFATEVCATQQYKDLCQFEKLHGDGNRIDPHEEPDLYARYWTMVNAKIENEKEIASRINAVEKGKTSDYKELWSHMRFVEAFREKPQEVHMGVFRSRSGSLWVKDDLLSGGEDVVEFLYNVGEEYKLGKGNPMISPICPDECRLIDQVNAWLQVVSPGAQIKISKREVADSDRFIQSVAFGRGGHEHEFKPQSVGFGISYVLPVLVALLTSAPEDIVVIENPEAHLHPRGQAEMGNLIARAAAYGVQVFVETHSDHVINGVRVAVKKGTVKPEDVNIAFFERKGHDIEAEDGTKHKEYYAEVRNIKVDGKGSLSEYPEDFMDEWNNQLMRLMKPRKAGN